MGLFNRKNSKPINQDEQSVRSYTSTDRTSTTSSLRSPGLNNGLNNLAEMPMPDVPLPKAPDPAVDPAAYLRSIHSVRQRSAEILKKAKTNQLNHFDVDTTKFAETANYVVSIIKVSMILGKDHYSKANFCSVTMRLITGRFQRMGDGNTSKLGVDHG